MIDKLESAQVVVVGATGLGVGENNIFYNNQNAPLESAGAGEYIPPGVTLLTITDLSPGTARRRTWHTDLQGFRFLTISIILCGYQPPNPTSDTYHDIGIPLSRTD